MMRKIVLLLAMLVLGACSRDENGAEILSEAEAFVAAGDGSMAMLRATDALECSLDSAQTSRAYILIAQGHRMAGNANAAMEFTRMAVSYDPTARGALVEAATLAGKPELALEELQKITPTDAASRIEWLRSFVAPAMASNRRNEAINALRELYADSVTLSLSQRVILAHDYIDCRLTDSAAMLMTEINLDAITNPEELEKYAEYQAQIGAREEALISLRRASTLRDSLMRSATAAGVYNRLYELEHQRHVEDSENNRRRTFVLLAVAAAFVVIGALLIYSQRVRSRRKILETENRLLLLSNELRTISTQQRDTVGRLFRNRYESIEMAANLILDGSSAARVMKEINARVEATRSPEFIAELEKAVNECHNGIIERMRRDLTLTDSDISTALFSAAGLSARVVCLILNCTPAALYNKKYRLKKKIQDSNLPDEIRIEYLTVIS